MTASRWGKTAQPISRSNSLAALRAIPNLLVIRPGDANETAVAWQVALENSGPVALILSRQNIPTLDRSRYAPARWAQARSIHCLPMQLEESPISF